MRAGSYNAGMSDTRTQLEQTINHRTLILDGATGTELTRRGVPTPLPLWSAAALIDHPDIVAAIHRDYVAAGADIIVANTFRTNPRTLERAGRAADGPALNRRAVELARSAAATATDRTVFVAASVAPVEDCYHPERVPEARQLRREHGLLMDWLAAAEPDLVWIETMNTVREAHAAVAVADDHGLPFVCSMVVREDGHLLSGELLEEAIDATEAYGPLAYGLNCIPPAGMTANLPRLRRATARPIAAYAHIGNPEPISGWSFSQTVSPDQYVEHARRWAALGASIIGGCCGTMPEHIRAVSELLSSRR